LRGWVKLDPAVEQGSLPIDDRGLAILKIKNGDKVELRSLLNFAHPRAGLIG
jgi:hypothetical protein